MSKDTEALRSLLATTPDTLAERQLSALRAAVVSRLGTLQGHIQRGEWTSAQDMLFDSPAGDGHGCDNQCIDFGDMIVPLNGCPTDISNVIDRLMKLEEQAQPPAEPRRTKR